MLQIMMLNLRAPLRYQGRSGIDPFCENDEEELIALFELDEDISRNIEPNPEAYLGMPSLIAVAREDGEARIDPGFYLFAQTAESMNEEDFVAIAIELQKEGLWRGLKLQNRVYLRALKEEDGRVFQVLRPVATAQDGSSSSNRSL